MDLTVAAFDDPARFKPTSHFGAESMHRQWINTEGLPENRTDQHKGLVDRWMRRRARSRPRSEKRPLDRVSERLLW